MTTTTNDIDRLNDLLNGLCAAIEQGKEKGLSVKNAADAVEVLLASLLVAKNETESAFHEHWHEISERTFAFWRKAHEGRIQD